MKLRLGIICLICAALVACDTDDPWGGGSHSGGQGGQEEQGGTTGSDSTIVNPGETVDTTYRAVDTVRVVYSGSTATVTGTGSTLTSSVSGGDVVLTNTGKGLSIIATGSGTGSLRIYSDYKYQLVLDNLTLTAENGPAICNQGHKTLQISLEGASSLTDKAGYATTNADGEDQKACFFSEGQMVFTGTGSLTVKANCNHGIASDDYIVISSGTIGVTTTANAAKAIKANDYISVLGGDITINQSGNIVTEGTDQSYCTGMKADSTIAISGGTISIRSSATGGRGLRSEQTILIEGGSLDIRLTGTGTESSGGGGGGGWGGGWGGSSSSSSGVEGCGIKAKGNITITGGDIYVSTTGTAFEGIESKTSMTLSGGRIYSISEKDDAINCKGQITFSGAWVYAVSNGNDAIDSNYGKSGAITITDGVVVALSAKGSPEEGLDCDNNKYIVIRGGYILSGGAAQGGGGGGWGGSSSSSSESVGSASQGYCFTGSYAIQKGKYYTIFDSSSNPVFTVNAMTAISSSSNSLSLVSAPSLSGSCSIGYSSSVPTGGTAWDGYIYIGATPGSTTSVKTFTCK